MSEDDERDLLASLTAATDQMKAAFGDIALMVGGYYLSLIGQGCFERPDAIELTRDYQSQLLAWLFEPPRPPDVEDE